MSMKKDEVKKVAVGTLLAAAAGYVAGILTAPKSGKETRGDIKDAAQKGVEKTEAELKKAKEKVGEAVDTAKDRANQLTGRAKEKATVALEEAKRKTK